MGGGRRGDSRWGRRVGRAGGRAGGRDLLLRVPITLLEFYYGNVPVTLISHLFPDVPALPPSFLPFRSCLPDNHLDPDPSLLPSLSPASGRFLHTKAYVERALAQAGLVVETSISYSPRVERGEPVPGFLYVVRRKRDGLV
jgi:hypothetical protein